MVDWITTDGLTDYEEAVAFMEARVAAIAAGTATNASGCWSIHRFTRPGRRPNPMI